MPHFISMAIRGMSKVVNNNTVWLLCQQVDKHTLSLAYYTITVYVYLIIRNFCGYHFRNTWSSINLNEMRPALTYSTLALFQSSIVTFVLHRRIICEQQRSMCKYLFERFAKIHCNCNCDGGCQFSMFEWKMPCVYQCIYRI